MKNIYGEEKIFRSLYILFILLPIWLLNAQTGRGAMWGVSINVNDMLEKNNSSFTNKILPPPDLNLFLGYNFSSHFQSDIYAGYITFADNWNGPELGLSLKYLVINNSYIVSGLEYNSINGGNNLPGNDTPVFYKRNLTFINLGVERFFTKKFFFEVIYSEPLNRDKIYGASESIYSGETVEHYKLIDKLRLSFGFVFSI